MTVLEQKTVRYNSQPIFRGCLCGFCCHFMAHSPTVFFVLQFVFFDEAQYWTWSQSFEWGYFSKPPLLPGLLPLRQV